MAAEVQRALVRIVENSNRAAIMSIESAP